jgi:hypothetical protein
MGTSRSVSQTSCGRWITGAWDECFR